MKSNDFLSFEDIRRAGRVVPLSNVLDLLHRTEPLTRRVVRTDGSEDMEFSVPTHWNTNLKELDDSVITSLSVQLNGDIYYLTKRAALTMLNMMGWSDRLAYKTPGFLLEPNVNYWFAHNGVGDSDSVELVTKDDVVVALMRKNANLVSNLEIVDQIRKTLKYEYDIDELFVDPSVTNNYVETRFRIIFPESAFKIDTYRNDKIVTDTWHHGIYVTNSLTSNSSHPLTISGFMIEESSLAGILPEYARSGSFDRSGGVDESDIKGWVHSSIEQVMAVMPAEDDTIMEMPKQNIGEKIGPLTTDMFHSMKIPRQVQEIALDFLIEYGDMSSYGLMYALAKASSINSKFNEKVIHHVQMVCGALPHRTDDVCGECGRLHLFD